MHMYVQSLACMYNYVHVFEFSIYFMTFFARFSTVLKMANSMLTTPIILIRLQLDFLNSFDLSISIWLDYCRN